MSSPTEPQILAALRAVKYNGEDIVSRGMIGGATIMPNGKVNIILQIEPSKNAEHQNQKITEIDQLKLMIYI